MFLDEGERQMIDWGELKSRIKVEYVRFGVPADRIVSDPSLSQQFQQRVTSDLPPDQSIDQVELNRVLLNLRKRGENKGGLPRLREHLN